MTIELDEEVEDVQFEPIRILLGETTVEEQLDPIATDPVAPATVARLPLPDEIKSIMAVA